MGQRLLEGLRQCRVAPELTRSQTPTGRVLSIITPDAQRSFLTCLGAAAESQHEDLLPGHFHGAAIVHLEGYLLYNEPLIMAALEHAKAAGALISIDFASFTVVAEARALLTRIVEQYADIVLANEDEARTFAETDDEMAALEVLSRRAKIAVVKLGARGSCIRHGAVTTVVAPLGDGAAVDTTGAGDLWAAGFLYGLVNGLDMAQSGALGSACGYEVCQVVGATIPEAGWQRIRRLLESFTMK
jgi:sugar/nucleoside kinase (ribokinase family)